MNDKISFFAKVKLEDQRIVFINSKEHKNRSLDKYIVIVRIKEKKD